MCSGVPFGSAGQTPRLTPPLGGPRLSQPQELGAHKATETGSVRGREVEARPGGSFGSSWRRSPPQPGATLPRCSPSRGGRAARASPNTPKPSALNRLRDGAELQSWVGRRGRSTSAGSFSKPSPPPRLFSPASQAWSRNHPPSKHQGPPRPQTHLPLKLLFLGY